MAVGFGKNVIFDDMSFLVHIHNKKQDILILGIDSADVLDNTMPTAEKEYAINFSEKQKKICFTLHYDGVSSYIFVTGVEIYKFKARDSKMNVGPLCLGNVFSC